MFTNIMKWFSVLALLLGLLLSSSAGYRIALEIEVCVAALVVVVQAIRMGKYVWGLGFIALALLFNPAVPVPLTHRLFLGLEWFSVGAFLVSLGGIKGQTPAFHSLDYRTDARKRIALNIHAGSRSHVPRLPWRKSCLKETVTRPDSGDSEAAKLSSEARCESCESC